MRSTQTLAQLVAERRRVRYELGFTKLSAEARSELVWLEADLTAKIEELERQSRDKQAPH